MTTQSNFLKGVVLGVGGLGIRTLLNIALVPLIIKHLGTDMYGFYLFCISLMELMLMIDLGLNSGLQNRLTVHYSQENQAKVQEQLCVGQVLYLGMGVLLFCVGYAVLPHLPKLFNLSGTVLAITHPAFLIVLLMGSFTLYANYFQCAMMARQCYHTLTSIESIYLILANISAIVLLLLRFGVVEILLARLILNVVKTGAVIVYGLKQEPHLLWPQSPFRLEALRELFSISIYALISRLAGILVSRVDNLVIANSLNMTAVAVYGIVVKMFGLVAEVVEKITMGGYSLTTRLTALQDYAKLQFYYLRINGFCAFVMGTLMLWMLCNYGTFFRFFSDGQINIASTIPLLFVAIPVIWFRCLNVPAGAYLFNSQYRRRQIGLSVVMALANLGLSLILVRFFGIVGVALGTLIPSLIEHYLVNAYTCRDLDVPFLRFNKTIYLDNLPPWLACLLMLFAMKSMIGTGVIGTLIGGGLAFVAASVTWLYFTASAYERELVQGKLKTLTARWQKPPEPVLPSTEALPAHPRFYAGFSWEKQFSDTAARTTAEPAASASSRTPQTLQESCSGVAET